MMAQDLPVVAATAVWSEAELAKLDVVVWLYVKKGFQQFAEEDGVMLWFLNVTWWWQQNLAVVAATAESCISTTKNIAPVRKLS
jgi:hypothetical protein